MLVTALIALAVMALLAAAAVRQAGSAIRIADQAIRSEQALYMANAGVEWALASYLAEPDSFREDRSEGDRDLGEGVRGSYEVEVTDETERLVIVSTGRVTRGGQTTTRVVTAEIPLDSGGGGGTQPLVYATGALDLGKGTICGDVYVAGELSIENKLMVGGVNGAPCDTVQGKGVLVVDGTLSGKEKKVEAAGGVYENCHLKKGSCPPAPPSPPPFPPVPPRSLATESYHGDYVLSGSRDFLDELIFIDGNLSIPDATVSGDVTFVVTGTTSLGGNLTCRPDVHCSIRIVTTALQGSKNNVDVWADLQVTGSASVWNGLELHGNLLVHGAFAAHNNLLVFGDVRVGGTLTAHNNTEIHGRLTGGTISIKNNLEIYPGKKNNNPPGGDPGSGSNGGGYSRWKQ